MISLTGGIDADVALMRGASVNVNNGREELDARVELVFADADFESAVDTP